MHDFIQNELEVTIRARRTYPGPINTMNPIEQNRLKKCVCCGADKPFSDFLRRSGKGAGARRGTCRACRQIRQAMLETAAAVELIAPAVPQSAGTGDVSSADGQAPKPPGKRKRRSGKRKAAVRESVMHAAYTESEPAVAVFEPLEVSGHNAQHEEAPAKRKRKRSRRRKNKASAVVQASPETAEWTDGSGHADATIADDANTASAAQDGSVTPEAGQDGAPAAPKKSKRSRRRKSKAAAQLVQGTAPQAPAAEQAAWAAAAPTSPAAVPMPMPTPAEPYESKSARKRRAKMLANGYGTPVFILPANALPLPPEQFETEDEPYSAPAAAAAAGADPEAAPKRKRKRARRRKGKPLTAIALAETPPRILMKRPLPVPPPGSIAQDGSELRPTRQGIIRMRGRTDKGRRWQQETDIETAMTLVREHAAVVVNPFTIRRLFTSRAFRMYVLDRDQYTCYFCGQYGDTIDHLRPRAKGGHTTPLNCVCACNLCNQSKADRDLEEFVGD